MSSNPSPGGANSTKTSLCGDQQQWTGYFSGNSPFNSFAPVATYQIHAEQQRYASYSLVSPQNTNAEYPPMSSTSVTGFSSFSYPQIVQKMGKPSKTVQRRQRRDRHRMFQEIQSLTNASVTNEVFFHTVESKLLLDSSLEMQNIVQSYLQSNHHGRHAHLCNQISTRFNFCAIEERIVAFWRERTLVGLRKQIETENISDFVKNRMQFYLNESSLNMKKISTMYSSFQSIQSDLIVEDLIWLMSNAVSMRMLMDAEKSYFNHLTNTKFSQSEDLHCSPVEVWELQSFVISFDVKLTMHFRDYINRQYRLRFLPEETDSNISPIERYVLKQFNCLYSTVDPRWCKESTKTVLKCRMQSLSKIGSIPSETVELYEQFYSFLLGFESAVLDFDAFLLNEQCDQMDSEDEPRLNSEDRFFNLYFGYNHS